MNTPSSSSSFSSSSSTRRTSESSAPKTFGENPKPVSISKPQSANDAAAAHKAALRSLRQRAVAWFTRTKNISPWHFAFFRIVFGLYLAWHFIALIPYGAELFSSSGLLPRASLNPTYRAFPNLLAVADAPWQITTFLVLLSAAAISFALGLHRRICALILWYGWACLFNRNNLIINPGIPYVGLLLLFCVLVPEGEPLRLTGKQDSSWRMPAFIYWGAWLLLAAGYTYSGIWKLLSPSWQDGSALFHLLKNPLARPGWCRDVLLGIPWQMLAGLSWLALAGELAFLPLSICRFGRAVVWTWMLVMHMGILLVVDFADLTFGMLMIHIFTFDPAWLKLLKCWNTGPTGSGVPDGPAACVGRLPE